MPLQNPWSWNRLANVLYMDHPAGVGFSTCHRDGKIVACFWDDVSQAEAFAYTLEAFFRKFTEMSSRDLYIVGESYFGQYGTNIGSFIFKTFQDRFRLKGMAFGNACHGGNETFVMCPGFNVQKNTVEFYFRHNFLSPSFYLEVQRLCDFPKSWVGEEVILSKECQELLKEMDSITKHRNIFFLRDNCEIGSAEPALELSWKHWKQPLSLAETLENSTSTRRYLHGSGGSGQKNGNPREVQGGFPYPCFVDSVVERYLTSPKVANALHVNLDDYKASSFNYTLSGTANLLVARYVGRRAC